MLSRIAESLFWIGRYVERADGTARIVDGLRLQLLELFRRVCATVGSQLARSLFQFRLQSAEQPDLTDHQCEGPLLLGGFPPLLRSRSLACPGTCAARRRPMLGDRGSHLLQPSQCRLRKRAYAVRRCTGVESVAGAAHLRGGGSKSKHEHRQVGHAVGSFDRGGLHRCLVVGHLLSRGLSGSLGGCAARQLSNVFDDGLLLHEQLINLAGKPLQSQLGQQRLLLLLSGGDGRFRLG